MPSEVYEEPLELQIDLLEAIPLTCEDAETWCTFPFPKLQKTGKMQRITFRAVVLENTWLKAWILPELGGRLLRLLDKRNDAYILGGEEELSVSIEDGRGTLSVGARWLVHTRRMNDLGPVDYQIVEPDDTGGAAGVWVHELMVGTPFSVHAGFMLPPDRAELRFEMRTLNRSFRSTTYVPRLEISGVVDASTHFFQGEDAVVSYSAYKDTGLAATYDGDWLEEAAAEPTGTTILPLRPVGCLSPRQQHTWWCSLVPLGGLGVLTCATREAALSIREGSVAVQTVEQHLGAKLVILTEAGPLEAAADFYPDRISSFDVGSTVPKGVAILDKDRNVLLRWDADAQPLTRINFDPPPRETSDEKTLALGWNALLGNEDPVKAFAHCSQELGLKAAALSSLGIHRLRQADYSGAAELFQESLSFNADDHLTWWMKALADRLAGKQDPEGSELPNAHFLAPLEPVLRAEAFLSQQSEGTTEPSPLIKALADSPDVLVEIASLLHLVGDNDGLSRWVHECLKTREVPMLRYFLADALLSRTRMVAEAAHHVQTASKTPINPPYPWRESEVSVLRRLSERFPEDARLLELARMATLS